jgi:hypothetical protein
MLVAPEPAVNQLAAMRDPALYPQVQQHRRANTAMSNQGVKQVLWWICLVVAPLVLIAIELFHPAGFTAEPGMYQFLSKPEMGEPHYHALAYFGPQWWTTLHMIQTPTVGLVSVGLWLLVDPIDRQNSSLAVAFAWLARAATLVFLVYYTALDASGGVALGRTILTAQSMVADGKLDAHQLDGIIMLLNATWVDPIIGGVGSFVSQTGSWAAFFAAFFAAAALLVSRLVSWLPLIPLLAFGWELQTSHAAPHGPIAFGLLIVAALWLRWDMRRRAV